MLQETQGRAGVSDREWDLSEQEAPDLRGECDAETDGGDAV